jgi:mono/diheme cytochrome c family protein/plastocyanin
MSDKQEKLGRVVLLLILAGIPLAIFGYQLGLRPLIDDVKTIDIVASVPEEGGFAPDVIRIPAGETVRLRFIVPDVVHGIAIGPGLGIDLGNIAPGEVGEIKLNIEKPGRYTIYCNTWCSPNHWRMRAIIEVYDLDNPDELVISEEDEPLLGWIMENEVDIDAPHLAEAIPNDLPSIEIGRELFLDMESRTSFIFDNPNSVREKSPSQMWYELVSAGISQKDAWDIVSYLWTRELTGEDLEIATGLYNNNCAACHGEFGDGEGPGADFIRQQSAMQAGLENEPVSFMDRERMLGGNGMIYYAKIRRGGMGTSMPGFGGIFTPEETWLLVDYIWMLVFGT